MRLIPGKTKVSLELFKGVRISDMIIGGVSLVILIFIVTSNIIGKYIIALIFLALVILLLTRMDDLPNYLYVLNIIRHLGYKKEFTKTNSVSDKKIGNVSEITAFTAIKEGLIEFGGAYYGAVIEVPAIEFKFFSEARRNNSIENSLGRVLRQVNSEYAANIIKIERPIIFDHYIENEKEKINVLKKSFEDGFLSEEELKARIEIIYDRIGRLNKICFEQKVIEPFYYIVLFDSDKKQLTNSVTSTMDLLRSGEMNPKHLSDKEIAVFLKYTNQIDFDEREIDNIDPEEYAKWAMPETIKVKARTTEVNDIVTHNFRVVNYPSVVGDAWIAGLMSIPATKVVVKAKPLDRTKAMRRIDHSLQELRGRLATTGVDSKKIELSTHIDTLSELLRLLQGDNETLLECDIYVTAYDMIQTKNSPTIVKKPENSIRSAITNMKKVIRRMYSEAGFRLNNNEFSQMEAYIGGQVSGYDPMAKDARGIPSNSLAASFPWIYSHVEDQNGVNIGSSENVPVFVDFFRRDSERVNSNMVIVGKSGSGKSFATKSILSNLAADNSKIFVLDPENEYTELANNLHGKFINVGNAQYGRLNPFHIITSLDDDESGDKNSDSYSTHLQFLEEFFRQILPDCEKDALEYLNSLIDRMYMNAGITAETDLAKLKPEDYPIFDNLYDVILEEFQATDNEYIRSMLRVLMNYTSKFSSGGRNATIWNGPSTVTTEENFTVFNFQSLLANRNGVIANAQMLLVLKYIDNEIIKNREYNEKYHTNRKIIVVIDEAHVFIDTKYPIALDFMFQLAKRIRKYNGMQIVITQNIKDFVGSEEIARKSTAIINACQYSFIFSLAPNDMEDLCKLYEKAGGINEMEQEQIVSAARGQAFTIFSPQSRAEIKIEVPDNVCHIFSDKEFVSERFSDEQGTQKWEEFAGDSRKVMLANRKKSKKHDAFEDDSDDEADSTVKFVEITREEYSAEKTDVRTKNANVLTGENSKSGSQTQLETVVEKLTQLTENIGKLSYEALLFEMQKLVGGNPTVANAEIQPAIVNIGAAKQDESAAVIAEGPKAEPAKVEITEVERVLTPEIKPVENVAAEAEEDDNFDFGVDFASLEAALEKLHEENDENEAAKEPEEEDTFEETEDYKTVSVESTEQTSTVEIEPEEQNIERTEKPEANETESDEPEVGRFDIFAFLAEEAEKLDDVSPIDMMASYGQTVITVSLEELTKYNSKK